MAVPSGYNWYISQSLGYAGAPAVEASPAALLYLASGPCCVSMSTQCGPQCACLSAVFIFISPFHGVFRMCWTCTSCKSVGSCIICRVSRLQPMKSSSTPAHEQSGYVCALSTNGSALLTSGHNLKGSQRGVHNQCACQPVGHAQAAEFQHSDVWEQTPRKLCLKIRYATRPVIISAKAAAP